MWNHRNILSQCFQNPYSAIGIQDAKMKTDVAGSAASVDTALTTYSSLYGQHPRGIPFQPTVSNLSCMFPDAAPSSTEMMQKLQQLSSNLGAAPSIPLIQSATPSNDSIVPQTFVQSNESKLRQELIATKLKLQYYEKQQREAQRKQNILHARQQQQQHNKLAAYQSNAIISGIQQRRSLNPINAFQQAVPQPFSQQEQLLMSLRNDPSLQSGFYKPTKVPRQSPSLPQPVEISRMQQLVQPKQLQQASSSVPVASSENVVNVSFNPDDKLLFAPQSLTATSLPKLAGDPNAVAFMQSILAQKQHSPQALTRNSFGNVFNPNDVKVQSAKRPLTGVQKPSRKKTTIENNKVFIFITWYQLSCFKFLLHKIHIHVYTLRQRADLFLIE